MHMQYVSILCPAIRIPKYWYWYLHAYFPKSNYKTFEVEIEKQRGNGEHKNSEVFSSASFNNCLPSAFSSELDVLKLIVHLPSSKIYRAPRWINPRINHMFCAITSSSVTACANNPWTIDIFFTGFGYIVICWKTFLVVKQMSIHHGWYSSLLS